jgi:hypothetical protein
MRCLLYESVVLHSLRGGGRGGSNSIGYKHRVPRQNRLLIPYAANCADLLGRLRQGIITGTGLPLEHAGFNHLL